MNIQCTIIGGGIHGLSTGILLESLGVKTRIISENFAYLDGDDVSTVASNLASASIYPVAVETDTDEDELIRQCRESFDPFFNASDVPVRKHTHYYLYEEDVGARVPARMDAQHVSNYKGVLPSRSGKSVRDGYICSEYFVEMPEYMPLLYKTYVQLGGETEHRIIKAEEIHSLPGDIVVNCSGYGSATLFNDDSMRAMKGHVLEIPYDGVAPLEFSYTYTPAEYTHYAYMYPRKETVFFDGSYLKGDIVDGEWEGESPTKPITVDGTEIPERLYTVNADLMRNHIEFSRDDISVRYGYRPYRSDGPRIERDSDIIHNYGHGGAGVSLSWVSAERAVSQITEVPDGILRDIAAEMNTTQRQYS